jgi:hypothetical protein
MRHERQYRIGHPVAGHPIRFPLKAITSINKNQNMKLIAIQPFYNSKVLNVKIDPKGKGFVHSDIIHRGCRFSIGTADLEKDLQDHEKRQLSELLRNGQVMFDNKENNENGRVDGLFKEIDAELAAAKAAQEAAAKSALDAATKK